MTMAGLRDDLSVAEQAALGSGADLWRTKAVRDVPSIVLTDGPPVCACSRRPPRDWLSV
jgi:beta-glucosidase